jgi:hypothetical protein
MRKSLIQRFMRAFGQGIWGQVDDKIFEICVLVAGILFILRKSGLSWTGLVEGRWEAVATGVWAISALVIWHAFRSAYALTKEIRKEENIAYPKTKLYGIALCLTGLVVTTSVLTWQATKQETATVTTSSPAPFYLTVGPEMNTDIRSHTGYMIAAFETKRGDYTIIPINLWLFVSLTNLQPFQSMIDGYSVEMRTKTGKWITLNRVDTRPSQFYTIQDGLEHARLLQLVRLDDVLLSRWLQPRENASGWMFFEYPLGSDGDGFDVAFRITLADMAGVQFRSDVLTVGGSLGGNQRIQAATINVTPQIVDLRRAVIKYAEQDSKPPEAKPEDKNSGKKDSKEQATKPKPKAQKPSPDVSVGSIAQGPCSNVQVGGSNNTATTNCVPPSRVLTAEKAKQLTRDFTQIPHLNVSIFPAGTSDDVQPVFLQLCNIVMDASWHPNCQGLNGTSMGGIKIPVIEGIQCFSSSWNTGTQAFVKTALESAGFGCSYINHPFTAE